MAPAAASSSSSGAVGNGNGAAAEEEGAFLDLGEKVRVSISTFKGGKPRVDIRTFWQDRETQKWGPTKKGCSLSLATWKKLKDNIAKVDEMLAEQDARDSF